MKIPVQLKILVPGYRAKWLHRYACFIAEVTKLAPRLSYGQDGEMPWIKVADGPRLYGFRTEPANEEVAYLLKNDLPSGIPVSHFRLMKDLLTRYVYPHMRPDLKPEGYAAEQMFGFHGQQKDAIADLRDVESRERLVNEFRPKSDDVIIDCGCFLGFGDLRMAEEISRGHIYAVEADRECFDLLVRNASENDAKNITPINRAAWNDESELELESGFAQANSLVKEVHQAETTQLVRTTTIDLLVSEYGIEKLDMISLTLNGAEVETLEAAGETLSRLRPRIRLAGWYSRGGRKIWEITKQQLEAHGYEVFVGDRGNLMALPKNAEVMR